VSCAPAPESEETDIVGGQAHEFVGRESCAPCHPDEVAAWQGSHHDQAMDTASEQTVLAEFDDVEFVSEEIRARFFRRGDEFWIRSVGADGIEAEFQVTYTFGIEPLQQYLVPMDGGRLQAFRVAWDTERDEWFALYPDQKIPPDDWLHWTRGGQNWNGMCADCHSTNLQKNYDPESDSYATTWSEIDVSCEACHGPGSEHVRLAESGESNGPAHGFPMRSVGLKGPAQVELCAPCHSRRSEIGEYRYEEGSLLDHVRPSLLSEGLYHADGQILDEVYVYGSFVQSRMFHEGVRCSDCHDVHSLSFVAEGNALCLQCHESTRYDSFQHHRHGTDSGGTRCPTCHMPQRKYMVVDDRADHSIRIPRPDLTLAIGTPNACAQSGCHTDQSTKWLVEATNRWYGEARPEHYGEILAAGRRGDPSAESKLVRLAADQSRPDLVRATALSLLAGYAGEGPAEAMRAGLADEAPIVRHTAATEIRPQSVNDVVENLVPLLTDSVRAVRNQVATVLADFPSDYLTPDQLTLRNAELEDFIASMEYASDFVSGGFNLGNLYSRLGRRKLAIRWYERAIAIDDQFHPAKVNLATLLNESGQNLEAERLLREVHAQRPDDGEIAYSLALLLAEMGKESESIGFFEQAAHAFPTRARIHYNKGLLEQRLGRDGAAEASLQRALELEPRNIDFLYALATLYLTRGQTQKAASLGQRMIQIEPDHPAGHQVLRAAGESD